MRCHRLNSHSNSLPRSIPSSIFASTRRSAKPRVFAATTTGCDHHFRFKVIVAKLVRSNQPVP
jgi:hypothetical protein